MSSVFCCLAVGLLSLGCCEFGNCADRCIAELYHQELCLLPADPLNTSRSSILLAGTTSAEQNGQLHCRTKTAFTQSNVSSEPDQLVHAPSVLANFIGHLTVRSSPAAESKASELCRWSPGGGAGSGAATRSALVAFCYNHQYWVNTQHLSAALLFCQRLLS